MDGDGPLTILRVIKANGAVHHLLRKLLHQILLLLGDSVIRLDLLHYTHKVLSRHRIGR